MPLESRKIIKGGLHYKALNKIPLLLPYDFTVLKYDFIQLKYHSSIITTLTPLKYGKAE